VRLGAKEVYMVYRRGMQHMSAFAFEYEHARQEGVRFLWHVQPKAIHGNGKVEGLLLADIQNAEAEILLAVDQVVLAIGQATHTGFLGEAGVSIERGRIVIDRATGQTSNPKYFAGGDCTNGGREVVDAVADGKRAGLGIAAWLGVNDANA